MFAMLSRCCSNKLPENEVIPVKILVFVIAQELEGGEKKLNLRVLSGRKKNRIINCEAKVTAIYVYIYICVFIKLNTNIFHAIRQR